MPGVQRLIFPIAIVAAGLAVFSLWPRQALAEIYRCQRPDGGMMYTDRPCEDMGATPAAADFHQPTRRAPPRIGCARNVNELVLRISNAVARQDTNQLAEVYHWTGMSGAQSRPVLKRLEAVVQRPLAGIVQVMPRLHEPDDEAIIDAQYYARRPLNQSPVALRIEQSSGDGISSSNTVFGLHRHFDCWWIRG